MTSVEAAEELARNTHVVWTVEHGTEVGRALGLPDSAIPVRDFFGENAHLTGDPKGYYPYDPEDTDQRGVAAMELAAAAIRYHHLYDAGKNFTGRGSSCRARAKVLKAFLSPMAGDDCPRCGAKAALVESGMVRCSVCDWR